MIAYMLQDVWHNLTLLMTFELAWKTEIVSWVVCITHTHTVVCMHMGVRAYNGCLNALVGCVYASGSCAYAYRIAE